MGASQRRPCGDSWSSWLVYSNPMETTTNLASRRMFAGKFFLTFAAFNALVTFPAKGIAVILQIAGYRYGPIQF